MPDGGISGDTITVQKGQTLSQIAEEYGVSVAAIQAANNLKGTNIIAGTVLVIPYPEPEFSDNYTNGKLSELEFNKEEREANAGYSREKIELTNATDKDHKDQVARLTINKKSGYVQINILKDITADDLKKLYNIPDGKLKYYNDFEVDWKEIGDGAGHHYMDYGNPTFVRGSSVIVPPGCFEHQGLWKELVEAFSR